MAHPPIENLIAHWKMNDNAADTTVVDNRGYANGVWTRNTSNDSVAGQVNLALNCGAGANYADMGDKCAFEYNQPFSICAWVKPGTNSQYGRIFCKEDGTFGQGYFCSASNFDNNASLLQVKGAWPADTTAQCIFFGVHYSGVWAHCVWTYDGSNDKNGLNLYKNGVKVTNVRRDGSGVIGTIQTTQSACIGARSDNSQKFNGVVDDVRLYNIELTQDQIDTIYNGGAGTEDEADINVSEDDVRYGVEWFIDSALNPNDVRYGVDY